MKKERRSIHDKLLEKAIDYILPLTKDVEMVLDINIGRASISLDFAKIYPKVISINPIPDRVSTIQRLARERGETEFLKKVEFVRAPLYPLDFPDGKFGLITYRSSLHHTTEPNKMLTEINRVLKPGGILLLMDFCFPEKLKNLFFLFANFRDIKEMSRYYTIYEIWTMLENSGFEIEMIIPTKIPRRIKNWAKEAPENIQKRILELFEELDPQTKAEWNLRKVKGDWAIDYYIAEIIAKRRT